LTASFYATPAIEAAHDREDDVHPRGHHPPWAARDRSRAATTTFIPGAITHHAGGHDAHGWCDDVDGRAQAPSCPRA